MVVTIRYTMRIAGKTVIPACPGGRSMEFVMYRIWDGITATFARWHQTKLFIEHVLAIDHDTLHLMVGMLLWLAIAAILRRRVSSPAPWLWMLGLAFFNEAVDLWFERWPEPGMQYGEGAKDLFLTMFIPTVILLAARFFPSLFAQRRR